MAQILQTLKVTQLKIQIDKCQFAKNSAEFLGHLITPDGIGPKYRSRYFIPNPKENKRRSCLPRLM